MTMTDLLQQLMTLFFDVMMIDVLDIGIDLSPPTPVDILAEVPSSTAGYFRLMRRMRRAEGSYHTGK